MPGCFITLEGIEGVGKSTNLAAMAEQLRRANLSVVVTREPGGTPLAEELRRVVLHAGEPLSETAELLLMFAARSIHVEQLIRPALARGDWVLCDRFTDATRAYQGGGRGQAAARIETLAEWVHDDVQPDLTVLLDAPVEVALARTRGRGSEDRFERETHAFFERVRASYLAQARREPGRFVVVDATASLEEVQKQLAIHVEKLILNHMNKSP
ncbi:MAG: dTMP kinase [Gammaproteobacteria bacterium]|nr:dTMP kinase [Gammaproteobacteria bacterium]